MRYSSVLSRLTLLLSIASSSLIGLGLALVPWTPLWEMNFLIQSNPSMRGFVLNAYTRGAVTGVGLVNIVLAVEEIVRMWRQARGSRNHR